MNYTDLILCQSLVQMHIIQLAKMVKENPTSRQLAQELAEAQACAHRLEHEHLED